jgi:hypothetical protein
MAAPLVYAGIIAVSTIYSVASSRKSSKEEAGVRRRQAALLEEQAEEMVRRARDNAELTRKQGRSTAASQKLAFADAGVDVGSGSALATQIDSILTADKIAMQNLLNAERDADLVRQGADVQREVAGGVESSQRRGEIGTILTGGANIAANSAGRK